MWMKLWEEYRVLGISFAARMEREDAKALSESFVDNT